MRNRKTTKFLAICMCSLLLLSGCGDRLSETETDQLVSSFYPARARDFWGICWENDSYNIWTQSGDIGVYCYKYEEMQWKRDESAQRPDYIISKYDKYSKPDEP